jgi:hypothetical protein
VPYGGRYSDRFSGRYRPVALYATAMSWAVVGGQFPATGADRSCAVGVGSVRNVQDDHHVAVLVDPITYAPVRPAAGGMLPGVFITQRMADTAVVLPGGRCSYANICS